MSVKGYKHVITTSLAQLRPARIDESIDGRIRLKQAISDRDERSFPALTHGRPAPMDLSRPNRFVFRLLMSKGEEEAPPGGWRPPCRSGLAVIAQVMTED